MGKGYVGMYKCKDASPRFETAGRHCFETLCFEKLCKQAKLGARKANKACTTGSSQRHGV